ncbi:MAG: winged helix DNA-binding protein [Novosphingobium sp.]|nr:winged helix DNA-binding protein [Novosphingobium sp.]
MSRVPTRFEGKAGGRVTAVVRQIDRKDLLKGERADVVRQLVASARQLLDLARSLQGDDADGQQLPVLLEKTTVESHLSAKDHEEWGTLAEAEYLRRRYRDQIFADPSLFGEPTWDILLDLMTSEMKGRKLSVTSACIGACVPSTTALRWLSVLENKGLVTRENDRKDGRRAFIRISPDGFRKMVNYFSTVRRMERS